MAGWSPGLLEDSYRTVEQQLRAVHREVDRRRLRQTPSIRESIAAIKAGTARVDDFFLVYRTEIGVLTWVIASLARECTRRRENGFTMISDLSRVGTAAIAGEIASYPLDETPPKRFVDHIIKLQDPARGERLANARPNPKILGSQIFHMWIQERLVCAALGATPDGMEMREAIANGVFESYSGEWLDVCGISNIPYGGWWVKDPTAIPVANEQPAKPIDYRDFTDWRPE